MKHFVYRTTHVKSKDYYVGRHSTNNLDDGYLGSGTWVKRCKKSNLVREIIEWTDDLPSLIEAEQRWLNEHFGKPGCKNRHPMAIGWAPGEHNPMRDPKIVAQLSGDNHWTRRNPEKVVRGEDHWLKQDSKAREKFLADHPNKDGRNAKLAMERGTHVNLGENNPSKQWSRDGTHPWFTKDGVSIGGETNKRRIAEGTHNWCGPEANQKRIEAGTHNLLGSSANKRMLAEGKHPSQFKITCEHCGAVSSKGMHVRWHGDNCRNKQK